MHRLWAAIFLFVTWLPYACAQSVHFSPVADDRLWGRLEHFAVTNAEREQMLKALFQEAGCPPAQIVETKVSHSKLPNVICTLPGETDRIIIVGAHFDKVDKGEGVADNWSGAAMLPSIIQALTDVPRKHTYVFVGFTDEEKGLIGSQDYVRQMPKEERQKVSAMVNLDTVGLAPAEVWSSVADKNLLEALATIANSMKLPIWTMNVDRVASSDSESFHQGKMPALTIHSVTAKNFSLLHTSKDTLELVQRKDYLDTYRLMCGYLAYLDVYLDKTPTSGSSK